MHIDFYKPEIQIINIKQILFFDLFLLYIMLLYLELITIYINYNIENK